MITVTNEYYKVKEIPQLGHYKTGTLYRQQATGRSAYALMHRCSETSCERARQNLWPTSCRVKQSCSRDKQSYCCLSSLCGEKPSWPLNCCSVNVRIDGLRIHSGWGISDLACVAKVSHYHKWGTERPQVRGNLLLIKQLCFLIVHSCPMSNVQCPMSNVQGGFFNSPPPLKVLSTKKLI